MGGPARSIDVVSLMHMVALLQDKFTVMTTMFEQTMADTGRVALLQEKFTVMTTMFEQTMADTGRIMATMLDETVPDIGRVANPKYGTLSFPLLCTATI